MTLTAIGDMTVDELVKRFEEICLAQYKALFRENISEYNKLYGELDIIDDELRRRGPSVRMALLKLYDSANVQVQIKAAIHTLAVAPNQAKRLLQTIADSYKFPQAADAGMILDRLKIGSFVPK